VAGLREDARLFHLYFVIYKWLSKSEIYLLPLTLVNGKRRYHCWL